LPQSLHLSRCQSARGLSSVPCVGMLGGWRICADPPPGTPPNAGVLSRSFVLRARSGPLGRRSFGLVRRVSGRYRGPSERPCSQIQRVESHDRAASSFFGSFKGSLWSTIVVRPLFCLNDSHLSGSFNRILQKEENEDDGEPTASSARRTAQSGSPRPSAKWPGGTLSTVN
jgi:hypothetical protein